MASGTNPASANSGQAAIDRFAEMMIGRMEQMKASDWKKGWIGDASGYTGLPQNVGGRNYSGSNSFFLQLHTAANGYDLPVFLTFKQAHNLKAHVLKGEKAFPVIYWDMLVKDKDGKRISSDEYRAMTKEERKDMEVIPFVKAFPVYNVAQTNLAEVQPERMQKLMDRFRLPELRDTEGMYAHAALDRMVETQGWVCPIQADKRVDGAYYSPGQDIVVLPMKAQFNIGSTPDEIYRGGMEFYSTMLHEMAHSTMTPQRLNRDGMGRFGDPKYAKEELVAELTAAMISHSMGFDSKVTDNSAAYPESLAAGHPSTVATRPTIADGIAVARPGDVPFAMIRDLVDEVVTVSEDDIARALLLLLERAKLVVEPAGAVGVAAILAGKVAPTGPTVVVLSGGNIDPLLMQRVISQGLSASGRYFTVRIPLPDRPGQLARVSELIAEAHANVIEVMHTRHGQGLLISEVILQVSVETRGEEHRAQVLATLEAAGYAPVVVPE